MSKVKVTPTEDRRLYIHPESSQEFPSGKVVETEKDWFINAKIGMGHLKIVEDPVEGTQDVGLPLLLEDFEKLNAVDQAKELVRLNLAVDEKDDSISNKEKRLAVYEGYLNGAGA
ncbi:hypothetical protein [Brevibacillus sp. FIR094]|uniref:hypothetical protein n=1 Tax=Brevibacillus sp. FIR094 TaxID=3134809 RepID=UPI003D21A221